MASGDKRRGRRRAGRREFGQLRFRGQTWVLRVRAAGAEHSLDLGADENEARALRAEIEARYRRTGRLVAPPAAEAPGPPTLREYWESIAEERRLRMKRDGFRSLDSGVRRALPYLGDAPLDRIRRRDLKRLRLEYRVDRAVTARTANSVVRAVSSVLSDAVEDELIEANPALGLKGLPVRAAEVRPRFYPALDDVEAVAARCGDDLRDLVRLSFDTRLRRKDLHDAGWPHVEWDAPPFGRLVVPDSKTGRPHFGWLTARARAVLERRRDARAPLRLKERNPIFPAYQGWRIQQISREFTAAAAAAGYDGTQKPGFVFHDLCRGYYRALKQLGVRPAVREAAAGHAPGSRATLHYDDYMPVAEIEEGVRAMSELIARHQARQSGSV